MEFLYPTFFWALLTLAVPVIIHLFYFKRYKKVLFSNVRFLKEVKEEKSSRNKLKHLLVLLSRLLALACLVLAFVQPFLGSKDTKKHQQSIVSLFVDNSYSMNANKDDVPLLALSKQKAREIVKAYPEHTQFQIITHDLTGKQQRLHVKEDAISLIDEINTTPSSAKMSIIANRQEQLLGAHTGEKVSYIISDFQQTMLDERPLRDTTMSNYWVPLQSTFQGNVAIDSVWLATEVPTANQDVKLVARLKNYGLQEVEGLRLSSMYNGQKRPEGTYALQPGEVRNDTVSYLLPTSGWHKITMEINDFPIVFDNTYYVAVHIADKHSVLGINQSTDNSYLKRLERVVPGFTVDQRSVLNVDYSAIASYDLVVLNGLKEASTGLIDQLKSYVQQGGNLLIFPPAKSGLASMNNYLQALGLDAIQKEEVGSHEVSKINTKEFVFKDVYERMSSNYELPQTTSRYVFTNYQKRGKDYLMKYRDGNPFMTKYTEGDGRIYVCATGLDIKHNNLPKIGEVWVPMLVKMAIATNAGVDIAHKIGSNKPIIYEVENGDSDALIVLSSGSQIIPRQSRTGDKVVCNLSGVDMEAGYYDVSWDEANIGVLAANASRRESDGTVGADLDKWAKSYGADIIDENASANIAATVKEASEGKPYWRYLLMAGLLFLLIETILLRSIKQS